MATAVAVAVETAPTSSPEESKTRCEQVSLMTPNIGELIREDYIKKPCGEEPDHALSVRIDKEFVNLTFETLGEVSEEIDQYWAGISVIITADSVPVASSPEDSGWVNITARPKVYDAGEIRGLLLSGTFPAKNCWRETLVRGFPEDMYDLGTRTF